MIDILELSSIRMVACLGSWWDHITSEAILATNGLTPLRDILSKWRASLIGHVTRLIPDVHAHQALWMQTDLSTGQKTNIRWRRTPGLPRKTWCCQIWTRVWPIPCKRPIPDTIGRIYTDTDTGLYKFFILKMRFCAGYRCVQVMYVCGVYARKMPKIRYRLETIGVRCSSVDRWDR